MKYPSLAKPPALAAIIFNVMKICSFLICFFMPVTMNCQVVTIQKLQNDTLSHRFTLTLSSFNHAEWLMNGENSYILTESEVRVQNTEFGQKKGKIIYSQSISDSKNILENLIKLRLDTLQEIYTNWCIMVTSGNEYFLDFLADKQKSNISLHHYYLKQVEDVVKILNSVLPEKFHIVYLSEDTKQDCFP